MHAPCAGLCLLNWLTSRSLLFVRFEGHSGFDSCGRTGCCQLTRIRPACVSEHFQVHTLSLTAGLAYLVAHCWLHHTAHWWFGAIGGGIRGNSSRRQLSIVLSLVAFRFLASGLHVQVVLVRFLQCSAHAAIRQTIVRGNFVIRSLFSRLKRVRRVNITPCSQSRSLIQLIF